MSSSSIFNVTFDCADAEAMALFWSEVTRWPRRRVGAAGNSFWLVSLDGGQTHPRLTFVEVPEAKTVKNRVHLDLLPKDGSQDQELSRLQSLGARILDDRRDATPGGWVVMADPEGNEFCLEAGD